MPKEIALNQRYNNGLTQKQVMFCEAYLENGNNAAAAAMTVGYGGRNAKAASCAAWGLLRGKTRTAKLIQQYINSRLKSVERKMQVGFDEKRKKLWHIADTCAPDKLEPFQDKDGKWVVKIPDPKTAVSAIAEMNKMDGDIAAEKRINFNLHTDADIKKLQHEYEEMLLEQKEQDY